MSCSSIIPSGYRAGTSRLPPAGNQPQPSASRAGGRTGPRIARPRSRQPSSILVPPHHARRTASSRTAVRPVAYCGLFFPPDHTGQATTESRLTSYVTVTTTIPAAAPPVAASSASRPREGKKPAAAARPRPPPTGSRSPLDPVISNFGVPGSAGRDGRCVLQLTAAS